MKNGLVLSAFLLWAGGVAAVAGTFPDAHEQAPNNWSKHVFRLSQDYKDAQPEGSYPWQAIDFKTQPEAYAKAVYAYALEGNIGVDWDVQNNSIRKWYHAPWMHYGVKGREFIRGMTRERTTPRPKVGEEGELGPLQKSCFQNWAVSFFNPAGGKVVGDVWADPELPDPGAALFPEGTVAAKLLFTAATVDEVPYLRDTFEWEANVNDIPATDLDCRENARRKPRQMRLLQIDISVRDQRADDSTGWVFMTFTYDNEAAGISPWDRMVLVGLMWGNDPDLTKAKFDAGQRVKETWINPGLNTPQHLGFLGRLNGPVDNPASACLSCHGTAQIPVRSSMTPNVNMSDPLFMKWFSNVRAGDSFDKRSIGTDYSLQISIGIQNYRIWHGSKEGVFVQDVPVTIRSDLFVTDTTRKTSEEKEQFRSVPGAVPEFRVTRGD